MRILAFLVLFLSIVPLHAQSSSYLVVSGSLEVPYGDFADPDVFRGGGNAGNGFGGELVLMRELNDIFALGLKVGYTSFNENEMLSSSSSFTVSRIPFGLNFRFLLPSTYSELSPYIMAGVSGNNVKFTQELFNGGAGGSRSASKILLGADLALGLRIRLSEITRLVVTGKWNLVATRNTTFELENSSLRFKPEFNANFLSFGLGIEIELSD